MQILLYPDYQCVNGAVCFCFCLVLCIEYFVCISFWYFKFGFLFLFWYFESSALPCISQLPTLNLVLYYTIIWSAFYFVSLWYFDFCTLLGTLLSSLNLEFVWCLEFGTWLRYFFGWYFGSDIVL